MSPNLSRIGTPFLILQQVDSTNNYATGLVHEAMADHGTVVFAHDQIQGKGQRNKRWLSAKNQNITLSVILKPSNLTSSQMFYLSMAIAVASARFMSRFARDVSIKWPNDIIISDRKAGGILIENIYSGFEWKFSIAGIGLNINQSKFPGLNATSIFMETGSNHNVLDSAKLLVEDLDHCYSQLIADPDSIRNEYLDKLYKKDQVVKLRKGNRTFEATIVGVTNGGHLIAKHLVEEEFNIGDVEWVY